MAKLEHLISAFFSKRLSDDSLPEIDCSFLGLSHDEQRRLDKYRHLVGPVFGMNKHLYLSQETILPFVKRGSINKNGSFGQIFYAEVADGHLKGYNKSRVAEKLIRLDKPDNEQSALREINTLRQRQHPNIVPLLASYTLKTVESEVAVKTLHLILPLAEMDLADWMVLPQPPDWLQELPRPERRACLYRFIYALVSALSFLHREKDGMVTAHHDMKPGNILVFEQELKIADFGRSHIRPLVKGSETEAASGLGTYEYHPPEYWKDNGYRAEEKHGRAFDVWSMGCIIIEIAILTVYGWGPGKVTEFRNQRGDNSKKERPMLAARQLAARHTPDYSFHNNWAVVEDWIERLQIEDGSSKLKSTLKVATQMMTQTPSSRLYAWEAELDLHNIQQPDDDRITRLEEGALCVQPPPLQRKILNGTQTPLHRAAQNGDTERLVQLFEAKWSLFVQDHEGLTALDVFKQSQKRSLYDYLCTRLAPKTIEKTTNGEQGRKLLQAATRGQTDVVLDLLTQGVNAMFVSEEGHSALYKAVLYGQLSVVECLLRAKGKDLLRLKDVRSGDTPLHKAASLGDATIIKQLLANSPEIEAQQMEGKTALFLAAEWGREEAVEVLLGYGAQVNTQQNWGGGTPLHAAVKGNKIKVLERLLGADDAGKCLEHKNRSGDTPLWLALFHKHFECAQILLNNGASLHIAENDGNAVLHVTVTRGLHDFLKENIRQFRRDDIQRTIKLGEEGRIGFQTVSSQLSHSTGQLSDETKAGFQMVSSQLAGAVSTREAKNLEALNRSDDLTQNGNLNSQKLDEVFQQQGRVIHVSEVGLQAVHSSLMRKGHKVTQALLSQYGAQLDQITRILGTGGHSVYSTSKRLEAPHLTTMETSMFWRFFSYSLPIGNLNIARQSIRSKRSASQDHTEWKIAVNFVPPWWLSSFAVRYVMKLDHDLIGDQWRWGASLNPLTINHDPFFLKAARDCVVEGVQESFRKGLARKTDYVLDPWGEPQPWQISSEPLVIDDLSPFAICLIGILAHADTKFRSLLKEYLASYRSPLLCSSAHATDQLFRSTFNIDSILTHFRNLEPDLRCDLLAILCKAGSPSMLKPFMDIGIDINDDSGNTNMLANAAAAGNTEIVSMLLDAGANGALAINGFLHRSQCLPEARFKGLLQLLVEKARPPVSEHSFRDPLNAILKSSRALSLCPEAPEILLSQGAFSHELLFGGIASFSSSYMFQAITMRDDNLMELLLKQGALFGAQIDNLFCYADGFSSYTWLTFSILCGAASCVSILISHGADVAAPDGSGRSAIQIAKSNAVASHPRNWKSNWLRLPKVTAEKDARTLAVVKQAFDLKFQGTENFEDYIDSSGQIDYHPPTRREKFTSTIQRAHEMILGFIFTRFIPHEVWNLWRLSFFEALLVRSIYVLSYFLLFAVEAVAFATGQKPIPKPSRTFLSAVAVLMLAIIWGGFFHFGT
ncbi:MAG: hypothetical protein Q9187_002336 [Circinaria calcarea]